MHNIVKLMRGIKTAYERTPKGHHSRAMVLGALREPKTIVVARSMEEAQGKRAKAERAYGLKEDSGVEFVGPAWFRYGALSVEPDRPILIDHEFLELVLKEAVKTIEALRAELDKHGITSPVE